MPTKKDDVQAWNNDHSKALLRGMIQIILNHRTELYTLTDLEGVSNNHGDRIRKKAHQMLKQLCEFYPGSGNLVEDTLKGLSGKGGRPRGKASSGKDDDLGGKMKKRKVKEEIFDAE